MKVVVIKYDGWVLRLVFEDGNTPEEAPLESTLDPLPNAIDVYVSNRTYTQLWMACKTSRLSLSPSLPGFSFAITQCSCVKLAQDPTEFPPWDELCHEEPEKASTTLIGFLEEEVTSFVPEGLSDQAKSDVHIEIGDYKRQCRSRLQDDGSVRQPASPTTTIRADGTRPRHGSVSSSVTTVPRRESSGSLGNSSVTSVTTSLGPEVHRSRTNSDVSSTGSNADSAVFSTGSSTSSHTYCDSASSWRKFKGLLDEPDSTVPISPVAAPEAGGTPPSSQRPATSHGQLRPPAGEIVPPPLPPIPRFKLPGAGRKPRLPVLTRARSFAAFPNVRKSVQPALPGSSGGNIHAEKGGVDSGMSRGDPPADAGVMSRFRAFFFRGRSRQNTVPVS